MSNTPYAFDFLAQHFPHLNEITYITSGGQKAVYAAQHQTYGKVALKILTPGASIERFEREIAAVQTLPGEHIPAIHEHGQLAPPHSDHLWLTEQWIDGISLREKLQSGPLSNALILKIGLDILEVLATAEANQIVHRDIKPENILIAQDESLAWLIDFGIARHLDRTTVTVAYMPYTLSYAPIEQLNSHKHEIDSRSDLFSLGVTLYECAEGVNPFIDGTTSMHEIFDRMMTMAVPEIMRQVDAKGDFKELVAAMTRMQRNHRIGSATEALEWIKEIATAGAA